MLNSNNMPGEIKNGDVVKGKYKIIEEIGFGGTSTVFKARDNTLNKAWAIKEIHKNLDPSEEKKLLAEADMMRRINHPAFPRILDIYEEHGNNYIIMDYIEGEPLMKLLQQEGPFDQEQVVTWALELCEILSYLHDMTPPIIYRDMKPSNLILRKDGKINIIDFGTARTYKDGKLEDTVRLGTRGYAPPEQAYGKGQTDARSDIYALGVTMYTLLTGLNPARPPYEIAPIRSINPSLSTGLEKIINKCTKADPDKRYQKAEYLAFALKNYEKYDDIYLKTKRKKIRKTFSFLLICVLFCFAGIGCIYGDIVKTNNDYNNLINTQSSDADENISAYEKAISLKPNEPEAYLLLLKALSNDFNDKNSSYFTGIYNAYKNSFTTDDLSYINLNYKIGEAYLMYYTSETDKSERQRILSAYPFFNEVVRFGTKDYAYYTVAENYVDLAEFYQKYIVANGQEATYKEYERLLNDISTLISRLNNYKGKDRSNLKLVSFNIIYSLIDSERSNMAKSGININSVKTILIEIQTLISDINPKDESLILKKTVLIEQYPMLLNKIDASYKELIKTQNKIKKGSV